MTRERKLKVIDSLIERVNRAKYPLEDHDSDFDRFNLDLYWRMIKASPMWRCQKDIVAFISKKIS